MSSKSNSLKTEFVSQTTEMRPPWEEFPTYERGTIGWRMGNGEYYIHNWYMFIKTLPTDYDARLAYLKRHRPAPLSWGDTVFGVLYPDQSDEIFDCSSESEAAQLLALGLIQHDAAYQTWLMQQNGIKWPWEYSKDFKPKDAARYMTRDFWFFSRQLNGLRKQGEPLKFGKMSRRWKPLEAQLLTGTLNKTDIKPKKGLLTLAQMFCAGSIQTPWALGLSVNDFTDSFDINMGYTDAFRLWVMSAFDDDQLFRKITQATPIPAEWEAWLEENSYFG